MPHPTLYHRLGGYDGVASYIALVFPRVAKHPELSRMFGGHGKDSQQKQFQLVVELICQKTGGPCVYIGRPMTPVHDGLGITEAHWLTFMKIITDGMNEKKYPADVQDEFLACGAPFMRAWCRNDGRYTPFTRQSPHRRPQLRTSNSSPFAKPVSWTR